MRTVTEFQIDDRGYCHSQYFHGAGVSHTHWIDAAVGSGMSPREAADEAAESLAQNDWEVSQALEEEIAKLSKDTDPAVTAGHDEHEECELRHYVVIYVR